MRSSISIDDEPNGLFALLQIFFGILVILMAGLGDSILSIWSRLNRGCWRTLNGQKSRNQPPP